MKKKELRSIGIIRDRGQITIPGEIRKAATWIGPECAVIFVLMEDGELRMRPYAQQKHTDWSAVWDGIRKARSFKGKRGNLSQFITSERQRRA